MAKTPRFIKVIGSVDETLYLDFSTQLDILEKEGKSEIKVELYSDGGFATVALAFYSRIRLSPCRITILATGMVASAATLILAAGDTRKMTKEAWVMVHEDGVSKLRGKVTELEEFACMLRQRENQWNVLLEERTGTTAADWTKINKRDSYLTAKQCLVLGLIDEIV